MSWIIGHSRITHSIQTAPPNSTSIIGLKRDYLRGRHTGRRSTGPQMDDFILAAEMRVPGLQHNQWISARPPWVPMCVCACVGVGVGVIPYDSFFFPFFFHFNSFSYRNPESLRLLPLHPRTYGGIKRKMNIVLAPSLLPEIPAS